MLCKFLKLDFIFLQFVFAICQRIFDRLFWTAGGFEVEATQRTGGEKREELPQESLAATRKSGGESERTACLGIRKEKRQDFTFLCRVLLINLNPRLEPPDQGFSWEPGFPGWPIKNKIRFPRWSLKRKKRFPRLKLEPARFSGGCHLQSTLSTSSTWSPREKANKLR